jgi:hypothetical protein
MISLLCSLGRKSLPLLAVLIVGLLPAASQAQAIKINNAMNVPLVVQVIYTNGRQVQPQPPSTLKPGDTTPAIMPPPGVQVLVRIFDANGAVLNPGVAVPPANANQNFSLAPGGPRGPKVILQPMGP